jgi:hypothetical protein
MFLQSPGRILGDMPEESEEGEAIAVPTVGQDGDQGHHMIPGATRLGHRMTEAGGRGEKKKARKGGNEKMGLMKECQRKNILSTLLRW